MRSTVKRDILRTPHGACVRVYEHAQGDEIEQGLALVGAEAAADSFAKWCWAVNPKQTSAQSEAASRAFAAGYRTALLELVRLGVLVHETEETDA